MYWIVIGCVRESDYENGRNVYISARLSQELYKIVDDPDTIYIQHNYPRTFLHLSHSTQVASLDDEFPVLPLAPCSTRASAPNSNPIVC